MCLNPADKRHFHPRFRQGYIYIYILLLIPVDYDVFSIRMLNFFKFKALARALQFES